MHVSCAHAHKERNALLKHNHVVNTHQRNWLTQIIPWIHWVRQKKGYDQQKTEKHQWSERISDKTKWTSLSLLKQKCWVWRSSAFFPKPKRLNLFDEGWRGWSVGVLLRCTGSGATIDCRRCSQCWHDLSLGEEVYLTFPNACKYQHCNITVFYKVNM